MHVLKKLPPILSSFAIIVTILASVTADLEINIVAKRIIIVGILFYIIGIVIKYYIINTISSLQKDEQNDSIIIEDDKANIVEEAAFANASDNDHQFDDTNSNFSETFNNESAEEFVPFGVQNVENVNDGNLAER